jgi:hypothetical protein
VSESKAEASIRLKSEGLLPEWDPKKGPVIPINRCSSALLAAAQLPLAKDYRHRCNPPVDYPEHGHMRGKGCKKKSEPRISAAIMRAKSWS